MQGDYGQMVEANRGGQRSQCAKRLHCITYMVGICLPILTFLLLLFVFFVGYFLAWLFILGGASFFVASII